jgi:hypothetical protein
MRYLALLAAFLALPAWANDCDPCNLLKSPTCAERIKRAKAANCDLKSPPEIVTVQGPCTPVPCSAVPCTAVDCKPVNCKPVDCKPTVVEVAAEPKGHFLIGGGPVRFHAIDGGHDWGVTAVAGWQFKSSGWQVQAGPIWMPQDDAKGFVTNGCAKIPFKVDSPSPWNVQALAVYRFD